MNKVIRACIALAAFAAFAVLPATASAAPNDPRIVDHKTGALAPVSHASPLNIVATNVGDLVMTDADTETVLVECDTATLTGKLETNEGSGVNTVVEGTITTAEFRNHNETECNKPGSDSVLVTPNHTNQPSVNPLPWCVRATGTMNTDEFQVRGGSCTDPARPIRFILHDTSIFGTITCTYERTEPIIGTYNTHPVKAGVPAMEIHHQRFERVAGGFLCPSEGFLDQKFNLFRDSDHTQLVITNQ